MQINLSANCDDKDALANMLDRFARDASLGLLRSSAQGGGPPGALRYTLKVDEPPIAQPDTSRDLSGRGDLILGSDEGVTRTTVPEGTRQITVTTNDVVIELRLAPE